jgi:hypothetical protein
MQSREQTCAERIHKEMESRAVYLEELYDKMASDEGSEEAIDEYQQFALDIEKYTVVKILLSTGGPADWIEVKVDEDGDIHGMSYHFQDWFDHASVKISSTNYLWQYAEEMVSIISI